MSNLLRKRSNEIFNMDVNITIKFTMNLEDYTEYERKTKISTAGKVLIAASGGIAVGLSIICIPFVSPALRKVCLPYVPATNSQIRNVVTALGNASKGKSVVDLGSGDGRIVLECAKNNMIANGVELNPWLVLYSNVNAFRKGLGSKSKFYNRDLWTFDISKYDNIVIFGVEQMMLQLEDKLKQECQTATKVIACRFPLPNLIPEKTIGSGVDTVWVYSIQ